MEEVTQSCRILGLESASTESEIRQAYRDLVKVWHPDRFAHDERLRLIAQEKLKEINGAYEFLMAALAQNGGAFNANSFATPETEAGHAEGVEPNEAAPAPTNGIMAWTICGLIVLLLLAAGWGLFGGRHGKKPAFRETAGPLAGQGISNGLPPDETNAGWESLFDGKSVEAW